MIGRTETFFTEGNEGNEGLEVVRPCDLARLADPSLTSLPSVKISSFFFCPVFALSICSGQDQAVYSVYKSDLIEIEK